MPDDVLERNHVQIFGRGHQPMLFAHGFGCDQNMWRYITPAFQDDYRLVLFDYVGSGKSDLTAYNEHRYGSLDGYAADVLDVCHALDLQDVILVGHSVSGVIGMLAAIQEPELFSRLILVGPSPSYINDPPDYVGGFSKEDIEGLLDLMDKNYIGWASFLAPTVMQNPERPELAEELQESFCSTDPRVARLFAKVTFLSDNRRDLSRVETPSLILQCSDDTIAPREVGDYLHAHLKQCTLKVMEATGHCPHMSHPEETIELIQDYLKAAPPQES